MVFLVWERKSKVDICFGTFSRFYSYEPYRSCNYNNHQQLLQQGNIYQQKVFDTQTFFKKHFPFYEGATNFSLLHSSNILGFRPHFVNRYSHLQHKRKWRRRGKRRQRNEKNRFVNNFMFRSTIYIKGCYNERPYVYNRYSRQSSQNILFKR